MKRNPFEAFDRELAADFRAAAATAIEAGPVKMAKLHPLPRPGGNPRREIVANKRASRVTATA